MQKYITKNRVFSSRSQQKSQIITPQKSLSKLKQRLNSGHVPLGTVSYNDRAKQEYMAGDNLKFNSQKRNQPKTTDYKKRRKQSLELVNRDIRFENQLREEIRNLNGTLSECRNLQNELIRQNMTENTSQIVQNKTKRILSSVIDQSDWVPKNLKELAYLQQKIKNRQKQTQQVTDNIAQLKQDYWNLGVKKIPLKQKQLSSSNMNLDQFILADQVSQLNLQLKATMRQYQKKYNELKAVKVTINNLFRDSERFYQVKVKRSQKSEGLLVEKPVSYSGFKQNLVNKRKQVSDYKANMQRAKSLQKILPSSINYQFSNISNVSAILPNNFIQEWLQRQLLPGEIPSLPKQPNPTMKSMNLKKHVLKQAIQTQKVKHQKLMTQIIDKLLFLHDEDAFLSQEMQNNDSEISGLETRFSWIQMRTRLPTTVSQKSVPSNHVKRKLLQEQSSIRLLNSKHHHKNYLEQNLLLNNTANNSSILDLTTPKMLQFP